MNPTLLAVAALAAAALAAAAAPTARVGTPGELRAAFDDPAVDSVLLTRSLALAGDPAWSAADNPARVAAGRALVIRSADVEQPATVNMTGAPTPAIFVEANASLALADAVWVAAKPPRADAPGSVPRWPAVPDLGLWPGVTLAPGAEFGLSNATMYVYGGCNAIGTCLKETQTRTGVSRGSQTVVPAGAGIELLLRAGAVECGVPIVQNRTAPGKGKGACV